MKKVVLILIVLLVGVFGALPALAGGWAVVTLDELPADVVAETPFTVRFSVRQHGQSLIGGLAPEITAVHPETGQSITVQAEAAKQNGYYAATITLPGEGQWRWHINVFGADQPMPDITVQPAVIALTETANPGGWQLPLLAAGGWAAAAGLLLFWWRTRRRIVLALGLITAVIGIVALVSLMQQPAETAVAQSSPQTISLAEQGEILFVAKGCVMCHVNGKSIILEAPHIGPDLTNYQGNPEFLHTWLADPAAMKKNTQMPDLQLSDGEIEALTAFLVGETAVSTSLKTGMMP
jgi:cytochrome c2